MARKSIFLLLFLLFAFIFLLIPREYTGEMEHAWLYALQAIEGNAVESSRITRNTGENLFLTQEQKDRREQAEEEQQQEVERTEQQTSRTRLLVENTRLRKMADLRDELRFLTDERFPYVYFARLLRLRDASVWRDTRVINRGAQNSGDKPPIETGLPVVSGRRLLGDIVEVGPYTSRIRFLTDAGFRIPVYVFPPDVDSIEPDRATDWIQRRTGLLEGGGRGPITVQDIFASVDIEEGDLVYTEGGPDSEYPEGLRVGKVTTVNRNRGQYLRIQVDPAENPDKIRDVMILQKP